MLRMIPRHPQKVTAKPLQEDFGPISSVPPGVEHDLLTLSEMSRLARLALK